MPIPLGLMGASQSLAQAPAPAAVMNTPAPTATPQVAMRTPQVAPSSSQIPRTLQSLQILGAGQPYSAGQY